MSNVYKPEICAHDEEFGCGQPYCTNGEVMPLVDGEHWGSPVVYADNEHDFTGEMEYPAPAVTE